MLSQWRGALVWRLLRRESNRPASTATASSPARPRRGGEMMVHRASKNLDVPETSHASVSQADKGSAGDLTPEPLLFVVCPDTAQDEKQRRRYRPHGSKHLSLDQATNIIEAVNHARTIGLPLVAHATIHWSGTVVFDDPDGKLLAKVREGLQQVASAARTLLGGSDSAYGAESAESPHGHRALSFAFPSARRVSHWREVRSRLRPLLFRPRRSATRRRHLWASSR